MSVNSGVQLVDFSFLLVFLSVLDCKILFLNLYLTISCILYENIYNKFFKKILALKFS